MSDRDDPRQRVRPAPGDWPPPAPGQGTAPNPDEIEWAAPPRPRRPAARPTPPPGAAPPPGAPPPGSRPPGSPPPGVPSPTVADAGPARTQGPWGPLQDPTVRQDAGARTAAAQGGPWGPLQDPTVRENVRPPDRTLGYGASDRTLAYGGAAAPPQPPSSPAYGSREPNRLPPPPGGPYGRPPGGFDEPPAYLGSSAAVRHRPGFGAVLGLAGLAALLASFFALPWVSAGGEDVTFQDIREASDPGTATVPPAPDVTTPPETDPGATDPAVTDPSATVPGSTVPGGTDPGGTLPSIPGLDPSTLPSIPGGSIPGGDFDPDGAPPDATAPQNLRSQVPGSDTTLPTSTTLPATDLPAPPEAAPASDAGAEYVADYVDVYWIGVLAVTALAVLFSTLLVPSGTGARCVTGLLAGGIIGLVANAADKRGSVGPRVAGVVGIAAASGAHGYALSEMFRGDLAPDPALGVWVGAAGLAVAALGCLVGTRTQPA